VTVRRFGAVSWANGRFGAHLCLDGKAVPKRRTKASGSFRTPRCSGRVKGGNGRRPLRRTGGQSKALPVSHAAAYNLACDFSNRPLRRGLLAPRSRPEGCSGSEAHVGENSAGPCGDSNEIVDLLMSSSYAQESGQ
jgi:hypothetical protein